MATQPRRPDPSILTIVLDVNVLVSDQNARRAGRISTISQRAVRHVTSGSLSGRPVQLAISFKMIDTYCDVLLRKGYALPAVQEAAEALVEIMKRGPKALDPYLVFGGTPDPAPKDAEDADVLATAFAADAGLLVTDNLADFSVRDCEVFNTSLAQLPDGKTRQLSCQIHTRADRRVLIVAHPADFVHWVEQRFEISPGAIRAQYPRAPRPAKHR